LVSNCKGFYRLLISNHIFSLTYTTFISKQKLSEITQLWSQETTPNFFIHYHSNTHDVVCEPISDFLYQDTMTKDLECYNGWTDVGIFIYFDDEVTLEECQECKPPAADVENAIAYYFEVRTKLLAW